MGNSKIIELIIALLLFVGVNAQGQHTQLLDSASSYYSNNEFEKAIEAYESILDMGYESAELYYNLGNAYYKSNKISYAILNFERAKKINSSDDDIEFNLKLANTHVVDKIDVLPEFFLSSWWTTLLGLLSSNQWAILSMAAFVLGLIGFVVFFLSDVVLARQFSFWLGILLVIISVFSFNFSRKQYWFSVNEPDAIILIPSVVVKSSPSEGGTELFLIHEGLKVTVTDKLGDWREIKLSDGNEGWIKNENLVII
jgi:tetratricopeptide (TPR) repeat protein